jgi:hypothetical protein
LQNAIDKAQKEIERLQQFIHLVKSYEVNSLDKAIIKEYILTDSINKTIVSVNSSEYVLDQKEVDHNYVVALFKKRGKDELHKLARSNFMRKTKYSRAEERRSINN